eukprot:TRINITY_DN6754_c1_g1_i1.p1 TRINITY_DN6754_c1_g1~~TRINITY_DN6754_c1_g1_i1.p1  ORF type:complete len:165 (+),score=26.54 TRINITY_DN6754_c1_g1_i1:101-595(+)
MPPSVGGEPIPAACPQQGGRLDPDAIDKDEARRMMEYDSATRCSKEVQEYYDTVGQGTAMPEDRAQRQTLLHFGFEPTEENLHAYRSGVIARHRQQGWVEGWNVVYVKGNHLLGPGRGDVKHGDAVPDCTVLRAGDLRPCRISEIVAEAGRQGRHIVLSCGSAT